MGDQRTRRTVFREGAFYVVKFQESGDAECNPGTLRIEVVHGNVLWRPK